MADLYSSHVTYLIVVGVTLGAAKWAVGVGLILRNRRLVADGRGPRRRWVSILGSRHHARRARGQRGSRSRAAHHFCLQLELRHAEQGKGSTHLPAGGLKDSQLFGTSGRFDPPEFPLNRDLPFIIADGQGLASWARAQSPGIQRHPCASNSAPASSVTCGVSGGGRCVRKRQGQI